MKFVITIRTEGGDYGTNEINCTEKTPAVKIGGSWESIDTLKRKLDFYKSVIITKITEKKGEKK